MEEAAAVDNCPERMNAADWDGGGVLIGSGGGSEDAGGIRITGKFVSFSLSVPEQGGVVLGDGGGGGGGG